MRDSRARARILVRIERLAQGNKGDCKPVGEGISELRIDYGPGYRVYYMKKGRRLFIERLIGRFESLEHAKPQPYLRKSNRVRTVQGSLAIEGNTLSLDQVTALIEGKTVIGKRSDGEQASRR